MCSASGTKGGRNVEKKIIDRTLELHKKWLYGNEGGKKADLLGANLSEAKGLLSAIAFIDDHFVHTEQGYIAYKTFGGNRAPPDSWVIQPNSIITENVLFDRTADCACGINVAPLDWVRERYPGMDIWKVLIQYDWLAGVCVPYNSDGKIRCEKVQLLEVVERGSDV